MVRLAVFWFVGVKATAVLAIGEFLLGSVASQLLQFGPGLL